MEPREPITTDSNSASSEAKGTDVSSFLGYPHPTSNTTYTPNQFFDVVLPRSSRGVVRLVGFMLRRVLGWSNPDGTPREPQVCVSYAELVEKAGISRGAIRGAIDEAIKARFIQCVSAGQAKAVNQPGASSLFELCWDDRGQYVTDPNEFQGFFSGNGNLTYIPNAFFDFTVRNELLSVVQVVGAIIRHSIGFQTRHGFRRQEISLSFDDLLRITRIESRSTVNLAIKEALAHRHIIRLESGLFGDRQQQSKAKYAICWSALKEPPKVHHEVTIRVISGGSVQKSNQENIGNFNGIGSKIEPVNSGSVQKSNQGSVQKSNQDRFKNRTSIEITDLNKTNQQQQGASASGSFQSAPVPAAAVCVGSFAFLSELGFDSQAARELATRFPEDRIREQVDWLTRRKATTNRLGLLRRAIEENWPAPVGHSKASDARAGESFARHYYAGYHATVGEPVVEPFPKDGDAASSFIAKTGLGLNEKSAAGQGRAFGKFVRGKHQGDPRAKPFLSTALVLYGEEFAQDLTKKTATVRQEAKKRAQEAHQDANWPGYLSYLGREEKALQESNSELYRLFLEDRERSFEAMRQFNVDPARFQTEQTRVTAFGEFFTQHPTYRVLSFWEWDEQVNPNHFAASETANA